MIEIGMRVSHLIYGVGTVLGNRHQRRNGLYYWHVQYDDGTFGYAAEHNLSVVPEE